MRAGAGWAGGGGEGDAYDARLTPAKGCLKKQRGALSSRVLEIRRAVKRTLRWADEVEGVGEAAGGVQPLAVGIAFSAQQVDTVARGPYDQPLDWVATETGLIRIGSDSP